MSVLIKKYRVKQNHFDVTKPIRLSLIVVWSSNIAVGF